MVGWLDRKRRAAAEKEPLSATARKTRTSDQSGEGVSLVIHG
jgi:hypothetical protein